MKTVVEIPKALLNEAERLSGLSEHDVIIFALESLVRHYSADADRNFGEEFSQFEFWNNPEEDIYNDLLDQNGKG